MLFSSHFFVAKINTGNVLLRKRNSVEMVGQQSVAVDLVFWRCFLCCVAFFERTARAKGSSEKLFFFLLLLVGLASRSCQLPLRFNYLATFSGPAQV